MRIAILSPNAGHAFGQERVIELSTLGLKAAGHEVLIIAAHYFGSTTPQTELELIPDLYNFPHLFTPLRLRRVLRDLKLALQEFKADVVHLIEQPHHSIINFLNRNYPTVFTAHTVSPSCPASQRLYFEDKVCERQSGWGCLKIQRQAHCLSFLKDDLHRAHAILGFQLKHKATQQLPAIIAISDYILETLIRDGFDAARITRIYNPIEHPSQHSAISRSQRLLLSACRLVPLKGIAIALHALKLIQNLDWEYEICGDGPERNSLEALADKLGLTERVRFLGTLERNEVHKKILECTLFLQPNIGPEGFGLSVAESLSLGTPTLASNVPAFNELITNGKNGRLVRAASPRELANAIKELLENPNLRTELGATALKSMEHKYTLDSFTQSTLEVYKGIIAHE